MPKHALVEQSTSRPVRKITAAGVGGLLATLVLTVADLGNVVELPTFVDSAVTVLAAVVAGYTAKARRTET